MNTLAPTVLGLLMAFASILIVVLWALAVKKILRPVKSYIRMAISVALLILVWAVWGVSDGIQWAQVILTVLALAALLKEIFALKKFYSKA